MTRELPRPDDIKLIVCDVDGTLLTSQHTLHPRTIAAFARLRAARPDLPIVISSGKQYNSCLWIREALGLPHHFPSAHCNGAIIYRDASGGPLFQNGLAPQAVEHIVKGTTAFGTFVFTEDEVLLVSPGEGIHRKDWCKLAGKYDTNVLDCTQEPEVLRRIFQGELEVYKVCICVDETSADSAKHILDALPRSSPSPIMFTRAIPSILEAISADIHKGTAVTQICESLGDVSPEQVLAFGDGDNDVFMFERVGHAVAMDNAMPRAKAAAKYTTTSNDDGGVGYFIEKVWGLDRESV